MTLGRGNSLPGCKRPGLVGGEGGVTEKYHELHDISAPIAVSPDSSLVRELFPHLEISNSTVKREGVKSLDYFYYF